jgi:RimJ/RimL family protein N-acetyltransferase
MTIKPTHSAKINKGLTVKDKRPAKPEEAAFESLLRDMELRGPDMPEPDAEGNNAQDSACHVTTDIRLRDVIETDLPILFEYQQDPDANRMAAFPPRDWDPFMAHWTKILSDKTLTTKAILLDDDVAGSIVSWERAGQCLVGYWIGKRYWGRGVATKALAEFLSLMKVRPLYAYVAKHNLASIRVLEKCGFIHCVEAVPGCTAPADGVEELLMELRH